MIGEVIKSAEGSRHGFVIAALTSGSGKTTVATGIMRALTERGLNVVPFKVGPDYIDTCFHKAATGKESINLDVFFSGNSGVRSLFERHSATGNMTVIEGVMGLFDGFECQKGSTAEIARITGLPVIMVIDASSAGYSLAAVLRGVMAFDEEIHIAGVIFNKVASVRHLSLLEAAAEDAGIRMLGYVGRNISLEMPSRHLGLRMDNGEDIKRFVSCAGHLMERHVDIDALCGLTGRIETNFKVYVPRINGGAGQKRIAVAHDESFNFIYPENLRSLETDTFFGGEITEFSPLHDNVMPEADFLYLPGGYPELYAEKLHANETMRRSIKTYMESGGYALAECGGMLYLGKDIDGSRMCGVLPLTATMRGATLKLGYRKIHMGGKEFRGHEFHYSKVMEQGFIKKEGRVSDVKGSVVPTPLYRYKNLLAGYTHIYWGDRSVGDLWNHI